MMPSLHRSISKKTLFTLFGILRFFLVAAAISIVTAEIVEVFLTKDVIHLALFAMFS